MSEMIRGEWYETPQGIAAAKESEKKIRSFMDQINALIEEKQSVPATELHSHFADAEDYDYGLVQDALWDLLSEDNGLRIDEQFNLVKNEGRAEMWY